MNTDKKITIIDFLEVSQDFHWATMKHYVLWFTGKTNRHHRTEYVLPKLAKRYANQKTRKNSLFAMKHGKQLIYSCPRRIRNQDIFLKVDHGLGCTETMVRLHRSDLEADVVPERKFFGCGSVPDFGMKYKSGQMLLIEFTTRHNFSMTNSVIEKIAAYRNNLSTISNRFNASPIILFVVDVPRVKIQTYIEERKPISLPIFFVDTETFNSIEIGSQLAAPIYLWGEDGLSYPLATNDQHSND